MSAGARRKRRRREAWRVGEVENAMLWRGLSRPAPKKKRPQIMPVAPRAVVKRIRAGGWFSPAVVLRLETYKPFEPKPVKRRDRRRPALGRRR